ncbi:hypothetical protein ACMV_20230 [Acidiphilium multivorum AIU301]|uniref:Uncharacterized protein n=1 Tax=Acidiphilium multivorum (strain DSM 11245 / JCM 8867 / NBRC 100883 / AIU 301) TaxID=926570 RepID=F0J010_ACIMA|nr:hypothetical protein ACMV_20230 [Acidiphilium multivorum AIU301]
MSELDRFPEADTRLGKAYGGLGGKQKGRFWAKKEDTGRSDRRATYPRPKWRLRRAKSAEPAITFQHRETSATQQFQVEEHRLQESVAGESRQAVLLQAS